MVTGIVLVNVERPMLRSVINEVSKIKGVTEVFTVAGEYDLVVMVRVKNNNELSDAVANKMAHDIKGISHTKTLISLEATSSFDLEKIYLS
jgi:DNA-binding Lrp family transcriptional regulator